MNALKMLQYNIGKEVQGTPSPFMNWLKPIILSAEKGKISLKYTVRNEMTNAMGNLHGGVSSGIIDDIIGATVFSLGEAHFYATINLSIDYLSAVKEGDVVVAKSEIIKHGKQLIHAQCEIWNADQTRLVARGQSNLLKTEISK
ncbi:MAG: PaaI family thioesterase [Bacteroidetes bacterium]|nr:PaaI family thioesterase [Bacteroidota bacterium]